jgi:hypothetical protein
MEHNVGLVHLSQETILLVKKLLVNGVNDLIAGGVDLEGQPGAITFKPVCF